MAEKKSWRNIPILNHFNCFALPCTTTNAVTSVDDEDKEVSKRRTKGGWKTMPYIIGNESCEKLAVAGLFSNMSIYLKTKYNMEIVKIVNILNIWSGTTSFATLGGAFLADSYIGRYLTIVIASLSYFIGMVLWTNTALVPALRPPHCSDSEAKLGECKSASIGQMCFLVAALIFMSIGSAGIRPSAMAFGADQFQEKGTEATQQKKSLQSFFNWYYLAHSLTVLVAGTAIVYLQSNVSWSLGFGVCTLLMLVSIIAFIIGTPIFLREVPQGSPFTGIAQIIVAFIQKRNLPLPSDPALFYSDQSGPKNPATRKFRFLNKAAIPREGDMQADGSIARPWRLSSIHKVEELKVLFAILPIYSCLIIDSIAGQDFGVFQAFTMNRRLGSSSFKIPAASIDVFSLIVVIAWLPLYDRVLVPLTRRVTKQERGITPLQRMGIGYAISAFSSVVAGFVEVKRRNAAKSHGLQDEPSAVVPISVFWLAPQYCIQGLANCFHAVGYLNFFYNEFPPNLRSTAIALASCMYAVGNYLSSAYISIIHRTTGGNGKTDWLDDNINRGRLDYFYWLSSAVEGINVLYFMFCASRYYYRENRGADGDQTSSMSEGREMESKQIVL